MTFCFVLAEPLSARRHYTWIWVIDQVWRQDGWILAKVFFCVFMDRDGVEVYKLAKKNEANIQSSWPNKLGQ